MPIFVPPNAVDVYKMVKAGYTSPADRIPGSLSTAQMAFAVGRNFKIRGFECPEGVTSWDDPILGTFFYCDHHAWGSKMLLQAWPHPQTGGKFLITATMEVKR